jgi:hypothetical protein
VIDLAGHLLVPDANVQAELAEPCNGRPPAAVGQQEGTGVGDARRQWSVCALAAPQAMQVGSSSECIAFERLRPTT